MTHITKVVGALVCIAGAFILGGVCKENETKIKEVLSAFIKAHKIEVKDEVTGTG